MTSSRSPASNRGARRGAKPERSTLFPTPPLVPRKPRSYGGTEEVVCTALGQAGGVKRVCALLDAGKSAVYGWSDPQETRYEISYHRARKLTQFAGVTAFAEDMAALAGGLFLPVDSAAEFDWSAVSADIAREAGELIARAIAAIGDGRVDAKEREDIHRELDDVVRLIASVKAECLKGGES